MDVGLAGRGRRAVAEQTGDHLDGHARADELGGMRVAEHVDGEVDTGAGPDAADELVHRRHRSSAHPTDPTTG